MANRDSGFSRIDAEIPSARLWAAANHGKTEPQVPPGEGGRNIQENLFLQGHKFRNTPLLAAVIGIEDLPFTTSTRQRIS